MSETGKEFEGLMELMARLRAEDGCPWDREQTPATIKRYLLEEVYEVVDAVDQQASDQVADELGDLIFMAIFLAHLYGEEGWTRYFAGSATKWCVDIPMCLGIAR